MSRPYDWSALDLVSDPTPGDPDVVRTGGNSYIDVADKIKSVSAILAALETDACRAESTQALLDAKDDAVGDVSHAENRYRAAGNALVTYSHTLDRVQSDTHQALVAARDAVDDASYADRQASLYGRLADQITDPERSEDKARYRRLAASHRSDATAANIRLSAQKGIVAQARTDRDAAAEQAIADIQAITSNDGLNDSWWDDWGSKIVDVIATIAEWVSSIAGILALIVAWIPLIGPALAGALLVVAAVFAIIAALANIALAATGKTSWTEAIISVVGAVLACVGLGSLKGGFTLFRAGLRAGRSFKAAASAWGRRLSLREGVSAWKTAGNLAGQGGLKDVARAYVRDFRVSLRSVLNRSLLRTPKASLPKNVRQQYDQYSRHGWKGNLPSNTPGTSAGGIFRNKAGKLPQTDSTGRRLTYREFDVNNRIDGLSRGPERFVRCVEDGKVYYTNDHYVTFTEVVP